MLIIDFIKNNSDWRQLLTEKPYALTIKEKESFVLFMYSQIDSDFNNPLVRECRGLILDIETLTPVCVPFYKFGNYGEGYVPKIDWNTARVQEKVDGSIIKVWCYKDEWHVSTNGTIDARDAELQSDICIYKNFYELFEAARKKAGLNFQCLNNSYTYMFELVSPYNRVVVPYTDIDIYHIGTRHNKALEELNLNIGVKKPYEYSLSSLAECLEASNKLPFTDEGYVVVDINWNRIKIKSPAYVAAHYLKNNGIITKARIIEMLRVKQEEEFLNYYPEYKDAFMEVISSIQSLKIEMTTTLYEIKNIKSRKEFAKIATRTKCPAFLFSWLDGKVQNVDEWLSKQRIDKIVELIEKE